jgi:hypothetical protein
MELFEMCENATIAAPVPRKLWLISTVIAKLSRPWFVIEDFGSTNWMPGLYRLPLGSSPSAMSLRIVVLLPLDA